MLEDGGIQSDNIVMQLGHVVPPSVLNVALEFNSKWSIIPGTGLTAVNFAGLINKTTSLAK